MLDRRVEILPRGRGVLAENGPLRLTIQAFRDGEVELKLAAEAAEYAFSCLEQVAGSYTTLRQNHLQLDPMAESGLAWRMIASVKAMGDEDLTPMAAVAGTIADAVADWLIGSGVTKAIVENGGDIAIRLPSTEALTVGLRPRVNSGSISHTIRIRPGKLSWGVNTSGMGGRSLTRGIASAVTAFASTSSLADAAATAIANSCYTPDGNIVQVPANNILPDTDLGELPVTRGVQHVSDDVLEKALANGLERADRAVRYGVIRGAVLVVQGVVAVTPEFAEKVGELEACE